ncbi:hypothetical protein ACHQM5_004872 [Ranunculus cassubicifolius]
MDDIACNTCGEREGFDEDDGFYYCRRCFARAEDIMDTEYQNEDFTERDNMHIHQSIHRHKLKNVQVKTETVNLLSQPETQQSGFGRSKEYKNPKVEYDVGEPCLPSDFGGSIDASQLSVEDLSSEVRMRYVMGVQLMIEFQCQVLVEKFGVSPLICGLAGVLWMRFVVASRVFDDDWADKTFEDSEVQYQGNSEERTSQSQYKGMVNMYGQSGVMIWFRSLRKKIPISSSLAVSFLACHIAREPILPTDIHTWSLEGKLPYLTAFMDIEKRFGPPSSACPLSSSIMFRPFKVIGSRELESQAGFIAQCIGLQLPPVNFFAIARRYLQQLSLPQEKILPHAARIHEWSMPPDLWLSANPKRIPTRVCVMSILMLTIRLLYNINGFGKWEASLSLPKKISPLGNGECSQSSNVKSTTEKTAPKTPKSTKRKSTPKSKQSSKFSHLGSSDFDSTELISLLEAMYEKTHDAPEYSKDLPTYLKYCKDVVFVGLKPLLEDNEEERIIEKLWNFYDPEEDTKSHIDINTTPREKPSVNHRYSARDNYDTPSISTHPRNFDFHTPSNRGHLNFSPSTPGTPEEEGQSRQSPTQTPKDTIKRMKLNMEENGFCYIPPRSKVKRLDHLHYIRKNDEGTRSYVAHGDYYILLRSCAEVAEVSERYLHSASLKLEKRLAWIENRLDQSLRFSPAEEENHSEKCDFDINVEPPEDMDYSI